MLYNWRKAGMACGGINPQGVQLNNNKQPTAWAHAGLLCAQAVFVYMKEEFMNVLSLAQELSSNAYPGRGIVLGRSTDGTKAVAAYFIMGRSQNSRNRVFVEDGEGIRTQAFDPSKLEDPSLIIYAPVRVLGNKTIVTNGDQTDTIYEGMDKQLTFEQSLRSREFEPDAPNYTPRISGIMHIENGHYNYAMSILKSNNGDPDSCHRYTFAYENPKAGEGHFIHTYMHDGTPLPSFEGEPKPVAISGDIDAFTQMLWANLNEDNKVSLFVRYIDIATGTYETRIVNKNQ
jgi:IMP cyclohydrolase